MPDHSPGMARPALTRTISAVASFYPIFLVLVLWEGAARLGLTRPLFLPAFSAVLRQFWPLVAQGEIVQPLFLSLYRAFGGFLLAMAVGLPIGLAMARSRWVHWCLDPLVGLGFPAPKIAFIPIFLLWFGIGDLSKILLVALNTVFTFILAAYAGAGSAATNQIWAARAMGDGGVGLIWRVVLPASLPSIMSGVRIAVPIALVTTFTAEMISGGGGLGGAEVLAERYFESPTVFADLLVMLLAGYVLDVSFLRLRRRILRWHAE